MRNVLPALLLLACSVEQGSGTPATEARDLDPIDAVHLSNLLDVDVRVGEGLSSIELTCDDNLLEFIETSVSDGTLALGTRPGVQIRPRSECSAVLKVGALHDARVAGSGSLNVVTGVVRDLESVSVSGSGAVTMEEAHGCDVELRVSGSGDIGIDQLEACEVQTRISGSGGITAAGTAEVVDAGISGSGDVDAGGLIAEHARVAISGSGDATVHALTSAEVRISGSGDVLLLGGADVDSSISGSGTWSR